MPPSGPGSSSEAYVPAKRPLWLPPFLGPVPPLSQAHFSLLGAVAIALLFEEYDLAMLTAALPQIAQTLDMAEPDFGLYLGLIRLGALPAFVLIPYADRIGRRRVFLIALVGTALATGLTAFSQTPAQFVICQMITRTFFVSGAAVAVVIIVEEFPAPHRGWGIGMLGALASSGHGIAMGLYSQIDRLPYGWRTLYAVGVLPLLLLPFFRRRIPETGRFAKQQPAATGESYSLAPLVLIAREYPARAVGIAVAGLLPAVGLVGAFQFTGYFTQTVHGWSPGQYAAMVFFGGFLGIFGNIVAGRLADRFGRRVVGITLLGSFPFFVALFYNGPGWAVPLAWIGFLFGSQGGRVIVRALATELFPTSQRASASGLYAILEALGGAAGLFVLYFGSVGVGDFVPLTTGLAFAVGVGGLVLLFFPETKQRELESITH
ncbi:MAG: MFS transporter [Myxococcota bacterium]|nr:MFS transporter [Myxococcota bacterium]